MFDATQLAHNYIAVWNETDSARRRALLAEGWAGDAGYVDPMAQAEGHEQISGMIDAVQRRFPGFRFALDGKVDSHGDRVRFSWTLGPDSEPDMIRGTDFAIVEHGRLKSITGFLDRVPASA